MGTHLANKGRVPAFAGGGEKKRESARKEEEGRGQLSPAPIRMQDRPGRRLTHCGGGLAGGEEGTGAGEELQVANVGRLSLAGGGEVAGESPGWREREMWGCALAEESVSPKAAGHRAFRPARRAGAA